MYPITNSTLRERSNKAVHYPNIVRIHNLESQHGDPDHPKNLLNCYGMTRCDLLICVCCGLDYILTLKVLVATIDALGHFETG